MELALPLAAAHAFRKSNLVSVAIAGSHRLSAECCPTVISKPVAEFAGHAAVVDTFPEVIGIVVVEADGLLEVNLTDLDVSACG